MAQLAKTPVYQIMRRSRDEQWMEMAISAEEQAARVVASALRLADAAAGYLTEVEIREREASWLSTPN